MTQRTHAGGLQVATELYAFINEKVLPQTGIAAPEFWTKFSALVGELAPKNKALIAERERIQTELDTWHTANPGPVRDMRAYKTFLENIGYLQPAPQNTQITTKNVDDELANQAGPQLVVPILNARYALNAANARWGSLYDALYGTDAISEENGQQKTNQYNPKRGDAVIKAAKEFLDQAAPLKEGKHSQAVQYKIKDGQLEIKLQNGKTAELKKPKQFIGYTGKEKQPSSILLINNALHIDIKIDPNSQIGKTDHAGISDITLEAAVSTILDLEDSVAAVDAQDKVLGYKNWLGIVRGELEESFEKNGKTITRGLNPDRKYKASANTETDQNKEITLHGRSLMFVRNVGHLMTNPAILYTDRDGKQKEIPEGIMDAVITTAIGIHDIKNLGNPEIKNSRRGSIYIVKPKMHGPAEVAFANELFTAVEKMLGLEPDTVKLGIMDEERRTSINLAACINAAKSRVAFINTGFLDRTGDEIHSCMKAGAVYRKGDMKTSAWINAYEKNNVITGLLCGLRKKAQIGKGMWAMPDMMSAMLEQKIAHPKSGANTAWVPSPTGAVLHATHYHKIKVTKLQKQMQEELKQINQDGLREELLAGLLHIPVVTEDKWTAEEKQQELENNAQGILGYVVRWVGQGVGCSKVPDINGIGLMEDRATLRISSQHIANWLEHKIVTKEQVQNVMEKMAKLVDKQNEGDRAYTPMSKNLAKSPEFNAACDLIFKGAGQPSGYTEPLLHEWRKKVKAN